MIVMKFGGTSVADATCMKRVANRIVENVERVIIGKHDEVELALVAMLCRGHVLIEDVPGVGKTMLARAIAVSTGCSFRRIQLEAFIYPRSSAFLMVSW